MKGRRTSTCGVLRPGGDACRAAGLRLSHYASLTEFGRKSAARPWKRNRAKKGPRPARKPHPEIGLAVRIRRILGLGAQGHPFSPFIVTDVPTLPPLLFKLLAFFPEICLNNRKSNGMLVTLYFIFHPSCFIIIKISPAPPCLDRAMQAWEEKTSRLRESGGPELLFRPKKFGIFLELGRRFG
jgi:hypothetical protein